MIKKESSIEDIQKVYQTPLLELISEAASVHRLYHKAGHIQTSTLLSVKTGGCTEDCSYCSQSVKHQTQVKPEKLMNVESVLNAAVKAKANGSTRFCMGAAWRGIQTAKAQERIVNMIKAVAELEMEVCCSLGMISYEQALQLKEAGLTYYNHNIDTSEEYYNNIVSTHSYSDRLDTIKNVRAAGILVCSGGILGMGESEMDRIKMIHTFATLDEPPESIPVNILVPIEGTPLSNTSPVSFWEILRTIATIRITFPYSRIRLSAGRESLSFQEQALCFLSGVNSIFIGEKLLTTPNSSLAKDQEMFQLFGIKTPLNEL